MQDAGPWYPILGCMTQDGRPVACTETGAVIDCDNAGGEIAEKDSRCYQAYPEPPAARSLLHPGRTGKYSDFALCKIASDIDQSIGSGDENSDAKAGAFIAVNLAPFVAKKFFGRSVPVAGAIMAAYDIAIMLRSNRVCTQEVYGR